MKTWTCKIGEVPPEDVPDEADLPMREAVERTYRRLTGRDSVFIFSGWAGELDESERAVVEDRLPRFPCDCAEDIPLADCRKCNGSGQPRTVPLGEVLDVLRAEHARTPTGSAGTVAYKVAADFLEAHFTQPEGEKP